MDTLRNYTFLPWLRQGIAAEIPEPDNLGAGGAAPQRAQVPVQFHVGSEAVSKPVELLGPGDVVGIHPAAIVKNRQTAGGPQLKEMDRMLRESTKRVAGQEAWINARRADVSIALGRLDSAFEKLGAGR